ncbi:hypothetical protein KCM76_11515 [Zooshikella marina]|uniref:hypothetical protein n=1 Tax=Zooshikella ganghwensis TaxID=202772 RepID=UPI001BAF6652|nr:hypothetical protein [Zooshikella ganghwensis]MBU2706612.1 hypothetical protein [Zooshikella ganghwensis]
MAMQLCLFLCKQFLSRHKLFWLVCSLMTSGLANSDTNIQLCNFYTENVYRGLGLFFSESAHTVKEAPVKHYGLLEDMEEQRKFCPFSANQTINSQRYLCHISEQLLLNHYSFLAHQQSINIQDNKLLTIPLSALVADKIRSYCAYQPEIIKYTQILSLQFPVLIHGKELKPEQQISQEKESKQKLSYQIKTRTDLSYTVKGLKQTSLWPPFQYYRLGGKTLTYQFSNHIAAHP